MRWVPSQIEKIAKVLCYHICIAKLRCDVIHRNHISQNEKEKSFWSIAKLRCNAIHRKSHFGQTNIIFAQLQNSDAMDPTSLQSQIGEYH